jgi:hypothetical protein
MTVRRVGVTVCLVALGGAGAARADEFKPAYLQLTQTDRDAYEVLWKVPAIDETTTLNIHPRFPDGTESTAATQRVFAGGAVVERWRISVPGSLDGKAVEFLGLSETRIDVLARVVQADGSVQLERILPVHPRLVVRAAPRSFDVARTYTLLGIEHILTGFDHLLYILGMLILVSGVRRIILTMSAFTATHSLTLSAAALGWVHVPQSPVEACIAFSILFVAREVVENRSGRPGLAARWPWMVSFIFGLMHGCGFAGALAQVGLPTHAIPIALLLFNVGVEIGQVLFVAAVVVAIAAAVRVARHVRIPQPTWLWRIPPYAIGALASLWLVERMVAL